MGNGKFRVRVRLAIIGLCLHTFGHNMLLISADVTQGIESPPLMIYGKSSDLFLLSEVCNPILAADSLCVFSQYVYEVCMDVPISGGPELFHLDWGFYLQ